MASSQVRSATLRLFASQTTIALLVAIVTAILVVQARRHMLKDATQQLQNISLILAEQAERSFEAVDLVQTTFMEVTKSNAITTPAAFAGLMGTKDIGGKLIAHCSSLPQLDAMALVDINGYAVNWSDVGPAPPASIADRSFFKALKALPAGAVFISEPFMTRRSHALVVVVAHRISAPNGDFLGLVFAGVRTSYFETLYRSVVENVDSAGTTISLVRAEMSQDGTGQDGGNLLAQYPRPAAAHAGHAAHSENRDGARRVVATHHLEHYPMAITVAVPVRSILAPWRKQAGFLIGAALLVEFVVVAGGLLVLRQMRDQRLLNEARAARMEAEAALALGQERERAARERSVQTMRFGAALANMSQTLIMFDAHDRLVVGQERLALRLGLPQEMFSGGISFADIVAFSTAASFLHSQDANAILNTISRLRAESRRATHIHDFIDGRRFSFNFVPMEDGGWLVTLEDITEQRLAQARIAHMAHHDSLTGLANRVQLHDRLQDTMALARRGMPCAVLMLDLDHFKAVNDTLGHPAGDALLRAVAQRLRDQTRDTDTLARLGGDEFAIVQVNAKQPEDCIVLAQRLIRAIGAPYEVEGHQVVVGASIGIAISPGDGIDPDQLLKCADLALYAAKADGRGRYSFFEPEMNARMQARRELDLDLRQALAQSEFEIHYQPQINIEHGTVSGFEALVRWRHGQRGLVSPADFIPAAEESGLVVPIGRWVLQNACADAVSWPNAPRVAVNLSPVQLGCPTLIADIAEALASTGLDPRRLELEITETAMLADTDAVFAVLHKLRDMGIGIALDDFGTGYSSLSYLRRFPFSKVKIDRSFVMELGVRRDCDAIVAVLTDLCARLGMTTTAEGVETAAQLAALGAMKCTEVQGYFFSRPVPAAQVAKTYFALARPKLIGAKAR